MKSLGDLGQTSGSSEQTEELGWPKASFHEIKSLSPSFSLSITHEGRDEVQEEAQA